MNTTLQNPIVHLLHRVSLLYFCSLLVYTNTLSHWAHSHSVFIFSMYSSHSIFHIVYVCSHSISYIFCTLCFHVFHAYSFSVFVYPVCTTILFHAHSLYHFIPISIAIFSSIYQLFHYHIHSLLYTVTSFLRQWREFWRIAENRSDGSHRQKWTHRSEVHGRLSSVERNVEESCLVEFHWEIRWSP